MVLMKENSVFGRKRKKEGEREKKGVFGGKRKERKEREKDGVFELNKE